MLPFLQFVWYSMVDELYLTPERITCLVCLFLSYFDSNRINTLVTLMEVEEESGLCLRRVRRIIDLTQFYHSFDA